jgi:flagellar P-ring protein precursor FlgI
MRKNFYFGVLMLLLAGVAAADSVESRVKDLGHFLGVRENQLVGFGLVVGLSGTGDSTQNFLAPQALANLLERSGITISPTAIRPKNVAAVTITATLPPFARQGTKIDIAVSSVGDASSLQGGILLQTALKAADGRVYAVAQGPVSIGGFAVRGAASGGANSVQRNQPTAGRIPNGALVEREVAFALDRQNALTLVLNIDDFTTASRAVEAINKKIGSPVAQARDSRTIDIAIPETYRAKLVEYMSLIEGSSLATDRVAKVIINEKTGTIIMGSDVKISAISIVHGNFNVSITTVFGVSQPEPFSKGVTTVVPDEAIKAREEKARSLTLKEGTSIEDVVKGLNSIGATPRDVIAIIQAIKAAGALNAELEII